LLCSAEAAVGVVLALVAADDDDDVTGDTSAAAEEGELESSPSSVRGT
jgi:hypothetical protein